MKTKIVFQPPIKLVRENIETKIEQDWPNNVKNWMLITKDTADLMIKECELALNGKIQSIDSTTSRADKLLSIYIPLGTALAVYTITNFNNLQGIFCKYLTTCSFICFWIALLGLYFCWKNTKRYEQCGIGNIPKEIIRTEYIDRDFNEKEQYINLALAICTNIHSRYNINDVIFKKRSKNNQLALRFLWGIPLCAILVFLFAILFGYPECYF